MLRFSASKPSIARPRAAIEPTRSPGNNDFENDEVTYYEADLMGNLRLVGRPDDVHGDLILGYRYLHAEYIYTSSDYRFEMDPTFQGPYVGLSLVF